jgi:hypothetical protein
MEGGNKLGDGVAGQRALAINISARIIANNTLKLALERSRRAPRKPQVGQPPPQRFGPLDDHFPIKVFAYVHPFTSRSIIKCISGSALL